MKYGQSKWCYKCGGAKMQSGGYKESWPDTTGFGQVTESRNLDQMPFFRSGGRVLPRFQQAGLFSENEFAPSNNWQSPLTYGYAPQQNPMGSTTDRALAEGKIFLTENEQNKTPFEEDRKRFDWNNFRNNTGPAIGRGINFATAGFAEIAGMYDRNMQQDYVNRMQNNPLSGILPFNDMRSENVEYGYNTMKGGGLFANYWAKRRRGEAAGTRKPNNSSASKEEWERSAETAKKKYGGTNLKKL